MSGWHHWRAKRPDEHRQIILTPVDQCPEGRDPTILEGFREGTEVRAPALYGSRILMSAEALRNNGWQWRYASEVLPTERGES